MGETFSFNPPVFKELYEKYEDAVTHVWFGEESSSQSLEPLSASQLKALIKTALWASLKHEEGEFHNFSLSLVPQEACRHPYILNNPVLFDEEDMAKLAPAFDPSANFIGLWPDKTGTMYVWGFASITEMEHLRPEYRRAYLFCEVIGPGQLLLSSAYRDVGAIFFSVLITGTRTEFIKLNEFLYWIVPNSKDKKITDLPLTDIRRASDYRTIAKAMRSHKHGGTLLIVQGSSNWSESIRQPVSYAGRGYQTVSNDVSTRNRISDEERNQLRLVRSNSYERTVEAAKKSLNVIGKLTAVDGATVMTQEFDVLAFGAKIEAKSKPEQVLTSTPFEGSKPRKESLSDLGGTRHQSAVQFVFEQKDAIAIVASQDGRISVMKWDPQEKMVCVMRPAEFPLL